MSVYITRKMLWQPENESKHRNAGNILDRLVRSVARKLKRSRTMAELRALGDRELRDIGLYREDIPRVVAGLDDVDLGLSRPAPVAVRVSA
ncbi:MAG: DUF1127 domain-containing protein [Paracoccaceae bacterium]